MLTLTPADFEPWGVENQAKLATLIEDALAQASIVAPCIEQPDFPYVAAARAILREAVLRRLDAGTGTVTTFSEGTGPFSKSQTIDNRSRRAILQPSDITDLQRLCRLVDGDRPSRGGAIMMCPPPPPPPEWHPFLTA